MPTIGTNVVVMNNGKVLLTKRSDIPVWCLPGGGVDAGESVAQTAVREVLEETGVQVKLTRLVGVYSRPTWGLDGDHVLLFTAVPIGGQLQAQDGETVALGYFAPDALPEPFLWWHRQRLQDALAGVTGAAWTQDVPWPFGQMTRQELHERRVEMSTAVPTLVQQLTGNPRPGQEKRELDGIIKQPPA
jgi:ADP-ribose pyrophosphatase YjhB (NUDIX family)